MKNPNQNPLTVLAALCLLFSGQALAEGPVHTDYTGLPIYEDEPGRPVGFVTIPASNKMADCEVVAEHTDLTGDDLIRCKTGNREPEAEWSYLY
jgi:hypothetical protein